MKPTDPLQEALREEPFTLEQLTDPRAIAESKLRELAALDCRRKTLQNTLDRKIADLKLIDEPLIQKLNADYEALSKELEQHVSDNRQAILPTDKKSITALHGEFGFKDTPGKVDFLPGWDAAKAVGKLIGKRLPDKLRKLVPTFVRLKLELDTASINAGFKAKTLTEAAGRRFGCCFKKEERFYFVIHQPQSATTP